MRRVSAHPPTRSVSDSKALLEAKRSGQPFLVFTDGHNRQQLFYFAPGATSSTVGRRQSSDLALDWDDQVSRLHARFERVEEDWAIVDDGFSRNGTFVNDERLSGRRRLHDGDTLRFGATRVTFHSPKRERPGSADAAEMPPPVALSTTQRRVLVALCRPYKSRSGFASPATDEQIAEELFLTVGEVRAHLRVLSAKLGVADVPSGEKRDHLVERAFSAGLISERDL
jgi:pSer/pThr/pTyr-binding forkhead associated (FHA) protein